MSKTQNTKAFEQSSEYYDRYREPEFVDAGCKEHTNFTPKDFEDDKTLMVLPIEKVEFDYSNMATQPRNQNLNQGTVVEYAEQAKSGVSIEGRWLRGIREPIVVRTNPEPCKAPFAGHHGHHRLKAAESAGFRYIVAKLDSNFSQLAKHEQLDQLMKDNAHPGNGMPSSDDDVKDNLKTYIRIHPAGKELVAIGEKLIDPQTTKADRSSLESMRKKKERYLTEVTIPRAQEWAGGRWDKKRAKSYTKKAIKELNNVHVKTKIHTYEEGALAEIVENHKKSLGVHHLVKGNCVNASIPTHWRQQCIDLADVCIRHKDAHKFDADECDVLVTVKNAETLKQLFVRRRKLVDYFSRHIEYWDKPTKFNFFFMGQCLVEGKDIREEIGIMYSLREVSCRKHALIKKGILNERDFK